MARFGSGINPALGAVDYSGFRQGALQGANSAIQGAQMQAQGISQGLSTLGQVVGDVGKQRLEFKTQVKAAEAAAKAVETIPDIDPKIIAFVKQQAEMMKDPNLSLRDQAAIGQQVNQLFSGVVSSGIQTIMQMQERERMAAPISRAFSPGAPLADTSPQGRAAFALSQGADPRLVGAAVEATTKPVQKPENLSFQDQALGAAIQDFQAQTGRAPNQGELFGIYQTVAQMSKPQTNISVGAQPSEYDKTLGKSLAERDLSTFEAAQKAPVDTSKLLELSQTLSTGDVNTGIFSELQTNFDRFRAKVLEDEKAGIRVTNDQKVDAMLGSDVFPMIGALGIGARGLDTPAEREFLLSVYTGTRKLDAGALQELARVRYNVGLRAANKFNKELGDGRMKRFEAQFGSPLSPVAMEFGDMEIPTGVTVSEWAYMTPDERSIMAKAAKSKGRR